LSGQRDNRENRLVISRNGAPEGKLFRNVPWRDHIGALVTFFNEKNGALQLKS